MPKRRSHPPAPLAIVTSKRASLGWCSLDVSSCGVPDRAERRLGGKHVVEHHDFVEYLRRKPIGTERDALVEPAGDAAAGACTVALPFAGKNVVVFSPPPNL